MSPISTAALALTLLSTLCLSDMIPLVSFPIANQTHNQWRIEEVNFSRLGSGAQLKISASFWLYRSYFEPCPPPSDRWVLDAIKEKCGWIIPDSPVECTAEQTEDGGAH